MTDFIQSSQDFPADSCPCPGQKPKEIKFNRIRSATRKKSQSLDLWTVKKTPQFIKEQGGKTIMPEKLKFQMKDIEQLQLSKTKQLLFYKPSSFLFKKFPLFQDNAVFTGQSGLLRMSVKRVLDDDVLTQASLLQQAIESVMEDLKQRIQGQILFNQV